jgi:hypothetical protein
MPTPEAPVPIEDVIRVARAELGTTESPPRSNRTKYGAEVGPNGVAWCAQFCWWVWSHAGHGGLLPRTASVYVMWEHAHRNGWLTDTPQVGDIPVYDFPRGTEWDHIGAVVTRLDGPYAFWAIEGNTSSDDRGSQSNGGGVFERRRSLHLVRDFIHLPLEDDMPTPQEYAAAVWSHLFPTGAGQPGESAGMRLVQAARGGGLTDDVQAIAAKLDALAARQAQPVDVQALAAAIVAKMPAGAAVDLKALAAAVADELATRLVR